MKKKDWILIIGLCVFLGVGYLIYSLMQGEKEIIQVYYHDQVVQEIDISKDDIYTFQGDYGEFHLEVKDHQYHATNVDCPNHDCEKVGWVKEGSSREIVCVPNGIYVIQAGTEEQY